MKCLDFNKLVKNITLSGRVENILKCEVVPFIIIYKGKLSVYIQVFLHVVLIPLPLDERYLLLIVNK